MRQKLESRQLPKEEGNFLNEIIKHANNFAVPLKDEYPELAKVFDIQLNEIMFQIQIADYFFDGQPRWDSSLSEDSENIILTMTAESQITNACEGIKKAKGIISAHATKFKIEGR